MNEVTIIVGRRSDEEKKLGPGDFYATVANSNVSYCDDSLSGALERLLHDADSKSHIILSRLFGD